MSNKKLQEKTLRILQTLKTTYSDAKTALEFTTPLELLVATVLSAQCTDVRVNLVTKSLFKKYRSVEDFAKADLRELEQDIHSTGFYKNKAKNIKNASQQIIDKYRGEVPSTLEELTQLPGVGRKTANVILGNVFNIAGITVDTHVLRLSNRIGLVESADPVKVELALGELVLQENWILFSHLLISHGRQICSARKPLCSQCIIYNDCDYPARN